MRSVRNNPWSWLPPLAALLLIAVIYVSGTNQSLFLALNRFGHIAGNAFWVNLTMLGDGAIALVLILPTIRRSPQRFWASLIAAVLAALWVQGWKHAINLPRPLGVFPPDMFFHAGPALRGRSFPSGHAAAISAVAGIWVISLANHLLLRWLLLALAILVGLSRIMAGVHWPMDVLGGMLGGWLAACAGLMLAERWGCSRCGIGGCLIGIGLLGMAVALLFSTHTGLDAAFPLQRTLAAVCLVLGLREMIMMLPRRRPRSSPGGP